MYKLNNGNYVVTVNVEKKENKTNSGIILDSKTKEKDHFDGTAIITHAYKDSKYSVGEKVLLNVSAKHHKLPGDDKELVVTESNILLAYEEGDNEN